VTLRPSTRAGQNKQLEDYAVNKEAKIAAKQKAAEEKAAAKKVRGGSWSVLGYSLTRRQRIAQASLPVCPSERRVSTMWPNRLS
jgi:hypothetical protein